MPCQTPSALTDLVVVVPAALSLAVFSVIYMGALTREKGARAAVGFGSLPFTHPIGAAGGLVVAGCFLLYLTALACDGVVAYLQSVGQCAIVKSGPAFAAMFTFASLTLMVTGGCVWIRHKRAAWWTRWGSPLVIVASSMWASLVSLVTTALSDALSVQVWVPLIAAVFIAVVAPPRNSSTVDDEPDGLEGPAD